MASSKDTLANNLMFLMSSTPELSTQQALEQRSGVGQTTIGRILRKDTEAKIDTVSDLARAFRVSASDLIDPTFIERISGASSNITGTKGTTGRVPLISWVTARTMYDTIESMDKGNAEEWLDSPFSHSKRSFCLRLHGESMLPEYKEGEIIQIDPDVIARHNDDVLALLPDGTITFRRLQDSYDGQYLLVINPSFPDRVIRLPEGTVICGVCIGSWSERSKR
ncbi:helix-turn-helix domain-containing protein [Pseudomonas aeruginosa]|uniref:helix-turn-helix domain-containing protein n=1 Tax=Pseudomonas aeruginosa TaxID=287 RepID=UPI00071B6B91|nr:S24 family peptidase [Pseudomonas aeruginosa]EKU5593485.1 helix-turn-helix domain-containing protein [Pseudomonas aeruginosa]EME0469260.1 helix-turn-helix domain-containing protein [Pseudomonas aeruginosa]MBQ0241146.1 helix-turn-helix domain-containing protein [Pseudomonas aeruginosa]MBQ0296375.1 helix-turn-helix domain-containing protein [Pseudomonas aeruginosa]MBT0641306.1 helix-turn-helix domain-containing protein [Pseudomonas aeruginosa]